MAVVAQATNSVPCLPGFPAPGASAWLQNMHKQPAEGGAEPKTEDTEPAPAPIPGEIVDLT